MQITFFKVVYRRHTNFSIESISNTFNGAAGFGRSVVCQISRNGDLIHRVYLQVDLPATQASVWVSYPGLRLIKYVEVEIGGQRIDKHYSDWMYIWNELSLPFGKREGYRVMTGDSLSGAINGQTTLYVPLEFWFNRNVGLALPLIALQYHEVKINIQFNDPSAMVAPNGNSASVVPLSGANNAPGDLLNASLWVDYIFLDTDERRRFAQLSHEYLIEQLQFTGDESILQDSNNVRLNFNHPVKELVWVIQRDTCVASTSNDWTNYSLSGGSTPVLTAQLKLNGQDRFAERAGQYFNLVQPFQHHENVSANTGIHVYSFALKPEEHQPSGTLNMSRIDTAVLALKTNLQGASAKLKTFAVNYNVLRIMSGMGGLSFSN